MICYPFVFDTEIGRMMLYKAAAMATPVSA